MAKIKAFVTLSHQSAVLGIERIEDKIVILDSNYTLNYYTHEALELHSRKKFLKEDIEARNFHKAFSYDENYLIAPIMENNKFLVYERGVHGLRLQKSFSWHESELESASLSPDDHLLVTGGQDGRVLLFDMDELAYMGAIIQFNEYVARVVFSQNQHYIAISSFNKFISIFSLEQHKIIHTIQLDDTSEVLRFYDDGNKLFYTTRNGTCALFDVLQKKTLYTAQHFGAWPTSSILSNTNTEVIVGTRDGHLFVINLENNEIILNIDLGLVDISRLLIDGDNIFVGFNSGIVQVFDMLERHKNLVEAMANKSYDKAKIAIKNNPFLELTQEAKDLEAMWSEIEDIAIELIAIEDYDKMNRFVHPF